MNSQPFMIEFINTYFREATRQRRAFLNDHGLVDEAQETMVNMMDASTTHHLTKGALAAQYRPSVKRSAAGLRKAHLT